jgi:hypothetical protein
VHAASISIPYQVSVKRFGWLVITSGFCSSLENERQAADWIKWLLQDGSHFEK